MASRDLPHPVLALFNPPVQAWFQTHFSAPTAAQAKAWPAIANGDSTLLLAPTGSGKTLAAFLFCLDRLMFRPVPPPEERCRVLYISPLKALAADVERNLRAPLSGIANLVQPHHGPLHLPDVGIRTGDTPSAERARFARHPPDILITTPESIYLLLTSNARNALRFVETVIIDEIHALVSSKRGAHLAVSLERLQALTQRPLQRIGLSATQRPLDEVARFLGGVEAHDKLEPENSTPESVDERLGTGERVRYRPVTWVDAAAPKALSLRVEVPVEDMAQLGQPIALPSGPASRGPVRSSIWEAIHPRLLELIRAHRSTLIFVNSRRVAERLAGALNELAQETLVFAHHGSIARAQRQQIEDSLKRGDIKGLVATSSLELGIDMGAIDLVVQIETPPSVSSGLQRLGRAGHQVGGESKGVIFPKYRADLVACAALAHAMRQGQVESSRYPRNPLDILAQHIVGMVALDAWDVEALFRVVRSAAPFADLRRSQFDGVLDLLAGRYASEAFSDLRPRIVWDRLKGTVTAREGARRVAVVNGGTIPDRGLYGVFLAGAERQSARVGELDEEMVFESSVGETFILGASTWRIEEITHDRVLVSPAPGQPGKMPFWRGDAAGRPLELGQKIGRLVRELLALPPDAASQKLTQDHDLDAQAAQNVLAYLKDQAEATGAVPDDRTLVVERLRDELGDWRICVLSPLGGKVHAPWAMAAVSKVKETLGLQVEAIWSDEGFVLRFPDMDVAPEVESFLPTAAEVEARVMDGLGRSALFAAKFRENAARALLLPRRRPGQRTPLWKQRKRAQDLLSVAAEHPAFPMLLETYRECLRDVFDLPALQGVLRDIEHRSMRLVTVDTQSPSPFAGALLFGFAANFLYEGDAPLAERRAQALSIDQTQLRELLGDAELRELLDADAMEEVERELQLLAPGYRARSQDAVHDLLRRLGDLSEPEVALRLEALDATALLKELVEAWRVVTLNRAQETRFLAVEDVARYRDALGMPVPRGLPEALLEAVADPKTDLVLRYARTHGPFTLEELARRYDTAPATLEPSVRQLIAKGKLWEGAFRPLGRFRELCDPDVLRSIRRRSLAKLRREVEPVEPAVLGRLAVRWHGLEKPRKGLDALLDTLEKLQGLPIPASLLETDILPARIEGYTPADLDALAAAGEVAWVGVEPLGTRDGRIALFLTDHMPRLWQPPLREPNDMSARAQRLLQTLERGGGVFFPALQAAAQDTDVRATTDALWELVWGGWATNDSFRPLRAFLRARQRSPSSRAPRPFRSRRQVPPTAEGRWLLVSERAQPRPSPTERAASLAHQLLHRYGLVTREVAQSEDVSGGFSAVYTVLKSLEESGRVRRGYFVQGVSAAQFALPEALDTLRSLRRPVDAPEVFALPAVDPANPYGALLAWPKEAVGQSLSRSVGAWVVLVNGELVAYWSKGGRALWTFLRDDASTEVQRQVARRLASLARRPDAPKDGVLVSEINGTQATQHPLARVLGQEGFVATSQGLHVLKRPLEVTSPAESLLMDESGFDA